jgi:uncharacterized protein (DUF1800 family)
MLDCFRLPRDTGARTRNSTLTRGVAMPDPSQPPVDPFQPFVPSAQTPFDHRRLSHLLRRAALGAGSSRLATYSGKTPAQVVDSLVAYDPNDDRPYEELLRGLGSGLSPIYDPNNAQKWWLMRMLDTPRPLQERIALFWHNHFATSTGKVRQSALVSRQIDLFRKFAMANFRDLLLAITKDAAMLLWLDGSKNKRGRPNENYAREVMELFTLGIGHYTEKDVQELARAFTGWQVLDESVEFMPIAFDDGVKTILGKTGKFNTQSAIDLLLDQPAAPRFIAHKLLKEFVHPHPQADHVEHYAARLLHHRWEIKPVVREILTSRLFYSDYAWRSKIKSPCELVVGAILALDAKRDTQFAREAMNQMGQALLAPPSVKGWDGQEVWINANTILQRCNFALDLVTRTPLAAKLKLKDPDAVITHLSNVLLDGQLATGARQRLHDYMNQSKQPFESKVQGVAHLIMCTPEYQLA